ncbi:DUF167 domain-containing protein [Anaerotardibacter muris]|uniref:DUF167 domain-containing protein n=1 Tax=Anaerotardibacter muris TaxID=2941505 RepID=UPI00203FC283|nr:DUF167 domain-containing protein [Anaerotardibacter muris]
MAAEGYKLALRLTPRSGRDAILGVKLVEGLPEVQACVTAPPDNGKANKALCKLVASELGIAKSKVEVVQGQTSRHKRLAIAAEPAVVDSWLASLPSLD